MSARNRFSGIVRDVKVEGLMAQVEMVVTEPAVLTAIVTADSVKELGHQARQPHRRGHQGHVCHGRALRKGSWTFAAGSTRPSLRPRFSSRSLGDGRSDRRRDSRTRVTGITVYAAASLTDVFPQIDSGPKYSFGASSTLAAQITQGAPADVFASANTTIPDQLFAKKLVLKPVVFTRNRLVLVVPTSNPAGIHSVYDLKKQGVKLVIAAPSVPVGSYTLQVLKQMGLTSVLSNVVSRESDVRSVLSKVALGEADAGFVYSTDAKTVPGKVSVHQDPGLGAAEGHLRDGGRLRRAGTRLRRRSSSSEVLSKAGQKKLLAAGFLPRVGRGGVDHAQSSARLRVLPRRGRSRWRSWRCRCSRSSSASRRAS